MRHILFLILLLTSTSCISEQIAYEIYNVDADGNKELIKKGSKAYGLSDLKYEKRAPKQTIYYLELEDGFSIGAVQITDEDITGFALQAIHIDGGFSWDWFDHKEGNIFNKRQECGEVSIQTSGLPGQYLIRRVNFITDVCLRLNQSDDVERDTHKIKIMEGSTLLLLP
ncbi:hypothetical protein R50072_38010 [Simiduia litorea]|uniref:hypothetical protein n=1 Tax=Simiduia litorea TaxID=1435348 RepID=UPI0036F30C44